MKPERAPFFNFYFARPVKAIFRTLVDMCVQILGIFGWWFCWGCKELHSPRVIKFQLRPKKIELCGDYCSTCYEKHMTVLERSEKRRESI